MIKEKLQNIKSSHQANLENQGSDNMKHGWEIKKLGEVCETAAGGTPLKTHKDYYEGGNIPWLLSGEVSQGEIFEAKNFITEKGLKNSSAKLFPPNTVLVAMYGATAGQVGILRFEAATNQAVCGILPNDKTIPEYLFYCFLSKKEELVAQAVGGAQPNISQIKIKNTKIPLPPLPEQQRIVSILDKAFAAIEKAKANAEQNLKNAKELFESYLQGVFEKKGNGWEEKRFEELIQENQIGLIKSTKEQGNDKPYRYLKMDSITSDNNLIHDRYVYVDADKSELEKFTLNEGDFLFNTRNSYELVGKTCVFSPIDDEPTLFNNNIMRVVFKNDISSRFINYAFSSELVKERLQKLKSGTTSVVGIYYKGLRNLKIPVTKYKEQQTIVRQLDALRAETQKMEAIYK